MANPEDPVDFMIQYLNKNHGKPPGVHTNEKNELEFLRKEVADLKAKLVSTQQSQVESHSTDRDSASQSSSGEESEDDDVVAELA